jgi:allantoate deiminase
VGALSALPGQVNVIAGSARATLDVRGPDDAKRRRVVEQLRRDAEHQAGLRGARVAWTETLDQPAVPMDPRLIDDVRRALARSGHEPPVLVSGAGHDAAVMAELCPTSLLFVRCREGLSHHPDEHVAPEDVRSALEATDIVLEEWLARWPW